jgi:hypothetical protein
LIQLPKEELKQPTSLRNHRKGSAETKYYVVGFTKES